MTTLKKQWIICLFAVIMLLSACGEAGTGQPLSGEQDDSEASNEVVEIEFLHMHAGDIIDKMVEEYHKSQNKVRVKPVFVQGNYEGIIEKFRRKQRPSSFPTYSRTDSCIPVSLWTHCRSFPLPPLSRRTKPICPTFSNDAEFGQGR